MATILAVDDSDMIRQTLVRLLHREGYRSFDAASARAAMELLETRQPDLILLDILMPEIDGLQLLEQLQTVPKWKAIPVIMMTAVSDTQCIRRCELLGARDCLVKAAFSVSDMLRHIHRYLDDTPVQTDG